MTLLSRSVGRRYLPALRLFSSSSRLACAASCAAYQAKCKRPPGRLAGHLMLKHEHLLRHPLDAEISERCLKTFLQELDPMKMYFYQSDYDDFREVQGPPGGAGPAGRYQLRLHGLQHVSRADRRTGEDGRPDPGQPTGFHPRRGDGDRQGRRRLRQDPGGGLRSLAEADQVRLALA